MNFRSELRPTACELTLAGRDPLPDDRGRLLNAEQIADLIGDVSASWVRRSVPGKLDLGHSTKRWWEADVLAWINSRREDGGDRR